MFAVAQSQHEPYRQKDQKKHSKWVKEGSHPHTTLNGDFHMHYIHLYLMQTLLGPIHHPNHPLNKLQYTIESA